MTDRLFITMPYADKELEIHYISDDEAKVRHITVEAFERWGWVRNPKDTGWMDPEQLEAPDKA